MSTVWKAKGREYDELRGDIECDVAIIGGGIAGLWCAYHLAKAGKKICILEAKMIGSGVTAGSSAILTYAQDIIYSTLNKETAKQYLQDAQTAMQEINKIFPHLEPIKFHLFTTKKRGLRELKEEQSKYRELGIKTNITTKLDLPYPVRGALQFDAFQFNPLELVRFLADEVTKMGGKIYEGALVTETPDGTTLRVDKHTITAKNFIVATHFPYTIASGLYWLKMWQDQNYCIAFKPSKNSPDFCVGASYESIDETGYEYRRVGENILMDGASVRVGKAKRNNYKTMDKHLAKYFDSPKQVARFASQDCMTMDKLPYAGKYSHFADNVFVVTGFNKWGMTSSYTCARVVTDIILGKQIENNIYEPQRFALVINPMNTATHVGNVFMAFLRRLLPGPVCSHMGCRLRWNRGTGTWDCPCHGSRFDKKGEIINGPATSRIQLKGCRGNCSSCKTCA